MEENEINESATVSDLDISACNHVPLVHHRQLEQRDEGGYKVVEIVFAIVCFGKFVTQEFLVFASASRRVVVLSVI